MKTECVYLDYNGTTPILPEVVEAMMPFLTIHFGNPSSSHAFGRIPKKAVEAARASVAKLVDAEVCPSEGVTFCGCGTEADHAAVHLALRRHRRLRGAKKSHVITTSVEHPAVTEFLRRLEQDNDGNVEVTWVPVDNNGRVMAARVEEAIRPGETVLVTIIAAQNEVGALQPVPDIVRACRRVDSEILVHTDAAQAVGKVDLARWWRSSEHDEEDDDGRPDLATVVGHKFGAPKGVAALVQLTSRHGTLFSDDGFLVGGGQEGGRRAGTENVASIVGMGAAAEQVMKRWASSSSSSWTDDVLESRRSHLLRRLTEELGAERLRVNGPFEPQSRLPNTLSVGIAGVHSGMLLRTLGDRVAASAGSACHSSHGDDENVTVSSVLREMRVPWEYAVGTLRLSLGPNITEAQLDIAASHIIDAVRAQWAEHGENGATNSSGG